MVPDLRQRGPRGSIHSDARYDPPVSSLQVFVDGLIEGIANSSYNALEASLTKRFSHGLSFLASYTYSKAIDEPLHST